MNKKKVIPFICQSMWLTCQNHYNSFAKLNTSSFSQSFFKFYCLVFFVCCSFWYSRLWQILTFTLIKCTDGQLAALETKRISFPVFGRWGFSYGQVLAFLAIAQRVWVLFSLYCCYCCCAVVVVLLLLDGCNCSVTLLLLLMFHSYCTVILFVVLCHLKFFR